MDATEQRRALEALIGEGDASLAALSRMLRRNPAWLQQYLRRGSPKLLPEAERGRLARFFGVDEALLGGPAQRLVAVPALEVAASAGAGRLVDGEAAALAHYPAETLAALGIAAGDASEIAVEGDSMAPTLCDGDRILVDRRRRRPGAAEAIWVIRLDDTLLVKRLVGEGARWRIVSDNPAWEDVVCDRTAVDVLGRVMRLTRVL